MIVFPGLFFMTVAAMIGMGIFSPPDSTAETGEAVTLEAAIDLALRANPDLVAGRKALDRAAAQLTRARVLPNPEIELAVENDALTAGEGEGSLSMGIFQEIRTGGKRGLEIAIAERGQERAQREIENLEREIAGEVREIFGEVLFLQERLRLQEEAIRRAREWVELTEGMFRAGYVPEFDLNLARIEFQGSLREQGNIAKELLAAKARLNPLFGRAPESDFTASGLLEEGGATIDLPILKDLALRSRPDLKEKEVAVAQARFRLALAKALRKPDLRVSLDYTYDTSVFDINNQTVRDRDHLFGGTISIPLMVLDKKRGEIEEAAADEGRAVLEGEALRARIVGEVVLAYGEWRQAEKDAAFLRKEILPLASGNRELTEAAYRLGKAGILEVMEARRRDLETRLSGLEAARRKYAALAALDRAVGGNPILGEDKGDEARDRLRRDRARGAGASEDGPEGHRTGPRIQIGVEH